MGGDRIGKAEHYRKVRLIWILMIIIGPLLLFLSGALVVISTQEKEWVTVYTENDFYKEYGGDYYLTALGSRLDENMRVIIKEKHGGSVRVSFMVEDYWGDEIYHNSGVTPETYSFSLDKTTIFDEYELTISIDSDGFGINDLDVEVQKRGLGSNFGYFCLGASIVGLIGLILLVLGIIFTVVYSHRITKQSPEYIRMEMLRKQERMMREQQARKAQEMERIRQRQAMVIRARNLEAAYRLEEAAFLYDRLDMYEDAGRCRRKLKEEVSRHIHVNANQLFDALQKRGTAIPYLCPQCHGMVDIDGVDKRYTKCPYCGAAVDFETLKRAAGNLF
ncbi:MAG: hypothetical protein ACMUHY_09320 [Thermoplasmatota archaeon]